jgi:hypothetical protein
MIHTTNYRDQTSSLCLREALEAENAFCDEENTPAEEACRRRIRAEKQGQREGHP